MAAGVTFQRVHTLIPRIPLSRAEFLGEMRGFLHPGRFCSSSPQHLSPRGEKLSRADLLGKVSDFLHSQALLPLIPLAPFSHTGRRGSLGVLIPETGDGTQGLAKTSTPVCEPLGARASRQRAAMRSITRARAFCFLTAHRDRGLPLSLRVERMSWQVMPGGGAAPDQRRSA